MTKKKSAPSKDASTKAAKPVPPVPDASNARMAPPAPLASAGRPAFRRPQSLNFAGVGRNDICPCGSGKRFKNCHGN